MVSRTTNLAILIFPGILTSKTTNFRRVCFYTNCLWSKYLRQSTDC